MMRLTMIALALIILTSCAQADNETATELTNEAQSILRETGRRVYNAEAGNLLDQALEKDPDYLPARQERLNLLLLNQEPDAAVEEAEEIARISDIPESRLFYCMLREHQDMNGPGRDACYVDVADRIATNNSKPYTDLNFVLALKLADSPDFRATAKKHIAQVDHEEVRALVASLLFEKDREALIESYLPVH